MMIFNPKKSQVKIGETVAVLFIFFILLLFGLIFYSKIFTTKTQTQMHENFQQRAVEISQIASYLPELRCSTTNIPTLDCIDILKLQASDAIMEENRLRYYDQFFYSTISVEEIFPSTGQVWVLYNTSYNGSTIVTRVPVSLLDDSVHPQRYSLGILVVEVYQR